LEKHKYLRFWNRDKRVNTYNIKNYLFRDKLKTKVCEKCGRKTWLGLEIPLSLHHIDGNRWNNNLDNLEVLCYNCHGLTDNYSRKLV